MTSRIRLLMCASFLLGVFPLARPGQAGAPITWTVTTTVIGPASSVGHGSIVPVSPVVNQGDAATFTFTPDPGYLLAGVDMGICGGTDNGDGTWTTDPIIVDCEIVATYVLSAADVVFQGDLEPDIKTVDNLNLDIPPSILGVSINWQTGATCVGTFEVPCDSTYHFRPSSNSSLNGVLVFRYPTSVAPDTYGVVSQTIDQDNIFSIPLVSGDTIGPDQNFDYPLAADSTAAWCTATGVDAFVGFRLLNAKSGLVNYGYAHLQTSPMSGKEPCGFPATIVGYAYDQRGNAIVIP